MPSDAEPIADSVTLIRLEQTCWACPSQWNVWDVDGTYYYIRFRWGRLTVDKGEVGAPTIFDSQISDEMDGLLGTDEMLAATGMRLSPSTDWGCRTTDRRASDG